MQNHHSNNGGDLNAEDMNEHVKNAADETKNSIDNPQGVENGDTEVERSELKKDIVNQIQEINTQMSFKVVGDYFCKWFFFAPCDACF